MTFSMMPIEPTNRAQREVKKLYPKRSLYLQKKNIQLKPEDG